MGSVVSAGSYVIEDPACYADLVRDGSLSIRSDGARSELLIDGAPPLPLDTAFSSPSMSPLPATFDTASWDELRSGQRSAQERTASLRALGVEGEVVYPALGLLAFQSRHGDLTKAIADRANDWLGDFSRGSISQRPVWLSIASSPERTAAELSNARSKGFGGLLLPGVPYLEADQPDYSDPAWDALWSAAVRCEMPITIHAWASTDFPLVGDERVTNSLFGRYNATRGPQELLTLFIMTGVFERFPSLRVVVAECEASWMPHYAARIMHYYDVHGPEYHEHDLAHTPREYLWDHVYLAVSDDPVAFSMRKDLNIDRLVFASLRPTVASLGDDITACMIKSAMSETERDKVTRGNCEELYGALENWST